MFLVILEKVEIEATVNENKNDQHAATVMTKKDNFDDRIVSAGSKLYLQLYLLSRNDLDKNVGNEEHIASPE